MKRKKEKKEKSKREENVYEIGKKENAKKIVIINWNKTREKIL